MEAGETAGGGNITATTRAPPTRPTPPTPSTPGPTAQNPTLSPAATNGGSSSSSPPITAEVKSEGNPKPTNGEPRLQVATKGADTSRDSGIGGGEGEGVGRGGGTGGFASLARKMTSKGKGVSKGPGGDDRAKPNGCTDDLDLPLGSEANSISSLQVNGIDSTSRISVGPDAVSSQKAAAQSGMMGWQSFNSDVSTSASTASLDMLLNDRLVDPEEVLFNLGFGGPQPVAYVPSLARIPERFLQDAASRASLAGDDGTADLHPGMGLSSPEDGSGSGGACAGPGSVPGSGVATSGLAAAVQAMQQQQQ
ncbi:hypothetical protein EGW08_001069, partial [Elysia chlorotica]